MPLSNPGPDGPNELDVVLGQAQEAERRSNAVVFIEQFRQGLLTVEDLAQRLDQIVREVQWPPTSTGNMPT